MDPAGPLGGPVTRLLRECGHTGGAGADRWRYSGPEGYLGRGGADLGEAEAGGTPGAVAERGAPGGLRVRVEATRGARAGL